MITGCWLKIISCLPKQSKLRGTNDVTLFRKKKKKKPLKCSPKRGSYYYPRLINGKIRTGRLGNLSKVISPN